MLEYEFEVVKTETSGYSLLGGVGLDTLGHREVIQRRGAAGWRYAGCIPLRQRTEGYITQFELVFQRETPEL